MFEDKWLLWKFKQGSSAALCRIYEKYKNGLSVDILDDELIMSNLMKPTGDSRFSLYGEGEIEE